MAAALAAVRLQPWQPDVGGEGGSHGRRSCGGRVSAFGGFPNREVGTAQQNRGKICRVPSFRTFSPRREALTSAMSEERDITDMQETDKVSGEWWNPILTAVRDWSHDKLLGLAELADGSLFFSFGPGRSDSRPSRPSQASSSSPQPKAQSEATPSSKAIPRRHPSRFRKLSPIPAYRKTAKETSPTAAAAADAEDKKSPKKVKTKSPSKVAAAQAQRPASSFSKRSPIPKERAPAPIAKKKNQETEVASTPATNTATESPKPPEPKESAKSAKSAKSNKGAVAQTPAKKKAAKVVVKEETVVEVAVTTSSGAESAKETSTVAAESEETTTVDDVAAAAENGAVASEDLGTYKLPELRSLAKARGLKGYSKLKKGELVDLLAALER